MYKWRLLLFASFAVFQPIASFTERSLVDGRQECCDRLPYSQHRDTKLAVYGTYRTNNFTPENRHLTTRRDISQNRRDEIKDLDTIFSRFTERQGSQERDHSRLSQDPEARITRVERRRVGTFNSRDIREHSSPHDRDYRVSLYRTSHDERSIRLSNERRSRISNEPERQLERMRGKAQTIRNNENLIQGTRNEGIRRGLANIRDGRRIPREVNLERRTYVSRDDTRRENLRENRGIDGSIREVDEDRYKISSPGRHIVEIRKMNDESGNYRLRFKSRDSGNNERRHSASRFEIRPKVEQIMRRSFDRDTNEASRRIEANANTRLQQIRNTKSELREISGDERRIVNRVNRRFTRDTNEVDHHMATNRYQSNNERRIMDQRKKDSYENSISADQFVQNRDRNIESRKNGRHERRNLNEISRRFERNVMGERVDFRSLDERDSVIVRSRRDTYIRRTYEESRNKVTDQRHIVSRTIRDISRLLDGGRLSTSRRINLENNIRERQPLERLTRATNENRRSVATEESRLNFNERRNIDLNDRRIATERLNLQRRITTSPSLSNSHETRYLERRFTIRYEQNRRFSEYRITELIEQVRKVTDETRHQLFANTKEERRSLNRVAFEKHPIEREQRRNSRISRDRSSTENRKIEIDIGRTQRSTDNSRMFNIRERLENDAITRNQRQIGIHISEERRDTSDARLKESRESRDRDSAHDRDNRLNQRSHNKMLQAMKARETAQTIQYRSKQEDTDRIMIGSHSRLSLSESRNRDTIITREKVTSFTPFSLDWQCVFYTLQGIYIFGIIVQMLNDNGSVKGKAKSVRWWGASTRNAIKID